MKRTLFPLFLLVLGGCGHPHGGTMVLRDAPSGIVVTGEGEAEAAPDLAIARVGIEVRRPSVADAREAAAAAATQMIAALRSAGIEESRIQTTGLSIAPEYEYTEQGQNLLGYTARNQLEVRTTALDRVSEVVDAAVRAGGDAARLEGIAFELENPAPVREAARREAMEEARRSAEQLAGLAGVTLGAPVSIEEAHGESGGPRPMMRMQAAEAATSTPVQAGTMRVQVTLTVRYAVE